jgi:hypothetical protein
MAKNPISNPLLPPLQEALDKKRHRGTGLVHRSWLLVLLTILDHVQKAGAELSEDDIYTYDYTLQGSRGATARLVAKHSFPDLGMKKEGVTTRGAPGLRFFKAVQGGAILKELDNGLQERFLKEAIDLLRTEARKVEEQPYLELPYSAFENAGTFLRALLDAAKKRSQGRVEQAVVEAKLQLRFQISQRLRPIGRLVVLRTFTSETIESSYLRHRKTSIWRLPADWPTLAIPCTWS